MAPTCAFILPQNLKGHHHRIGTAYDRKPEEYLDGVVPDVTLFTQILSASEVLRSPGFS
jgi:hypothetical protein